MHYILGVKPKDHGYLTEWLEAYDTPRYFGFTDKKGRKHVYEWMNDVPLNGRDDTVKVNYFSYKIKHR